MSLFPRKFRSKSVTTPPRESDLCQSCPNLLDLDDNFAGVSGANVPACSNSSRSAALTPGPEFMSLETGAMSPKGQKSTKKNKCLLFLPVKFRRAKERKAQTQALKLPVYPINSSHDASPSSSMMVQSPLQDSLEPPTNVRPKHTRPTGLGLGLRGLLGNNLRSSPMSSSKLRRGSDSCIPSPSLGIKQVHNTLLATVIEHCNSDDDNCRGSNLESNYLKSPSPGSYNSRCLRRGSDSCILSPSRDTEQSLRLLGTDIEHSNIMGEEDCCSSDLDSRQSCPDLLKPSTSFTDGDTSISISPICIVVSSSGDESGRNLLKAADPYKKYLGKSLEQVWLIVIYECILWGD